jgi:hypothetical protein
MTQQTENFILWVVQIMSRGSSCAVPLELYILLSNITSSELRALCKIFPLTEMNPDIFIPFVNIWHYNSVKLCVQKRLLDNI